MTQYLRISGRLTHIADGATTACGQDIPGEAEVIVQPPKAGRCETCTQVNAIRSELKDAWITKRDVNRTKMLRELVELRSKTRSL